MLKHDKKVAKAKGLPVNTGYVPRAPHPLLDTSQNGNKAAPAPAPVIAAEEDDDDEDELQQQNEKEAAAGGAAAL
jgi:hypothetical protein